MVRTLMSPYRWALFFFLLSGCTRIPPPNDGGIPYCIAARTGGKDLFWRRTCSQPFDVETYLQQTLCQDLTVDNAVRIALLHNPHIQALFEEIGIAQADFLQAGLFKNPLIEGVVRFPTRSGFAVNTELSLLFSFLDLFLVPLKKKVAQAEVEEIKLHVAHAILDLVFTVEETYYALAAEKLRLKMLEAIAEILQAANEVAEAQLQAGTLYSLNAAIVSAAALQAEIKSKQSALMIISLRKEMNQLLGLREKDSCWDVESELCAIEQEELCLDTLVTIAFAERLDLREKEWELEKLARTGALKQWWAYTDLMAGAGYAYDIESVSIIGPAFGIALPFFNYGQADRARLCAEFWQTLQQLRAKKVVIASEVEESYLSILALRSLVLKFQNELIPTYEQVAASSQLLYNRMIADVYHLIENKQNELQAWLDYYSTLRDYWIAKVGLERALGGKCG